MNDRSKKHKINVSYIFNLKSHVIAKHGNCSEKIRWKNNILSQTICLQGVVCKVLNRKALSGETFCFLENVCYQHSNVVLRVTYCFFTSC